MKNKILVEEGADEELDPNLCFEIKLTQNTGLDTQTCKELGKNAIKQEISASNIL